MSSLASDLNRAALGSPDAALAPRDTQGRADYLRDRIGLFARLFLALGSFFLVAGSLYRWAFLNSGPLSTLSLDTVTRTHLSLLGLQALVWYSLRRGLWSAAVLPWLDAALTLCTLSAQAFQISHLQLGGLHHVDQLMVLTTYCVLTCRAVTIPSKPVITLLVSALGVVPALVVAFWDGGQRGVLRQAVAFTAIWCTAAALLATFISHVIYGLRESVGQAQQLGQYVIEKKIGEGGMGEVYLARHTLLRRATAIKLLPPERAGVGTIARFEREVRATSRLTHPNTVSIFDYGRTRDGVFYYAMEYLDGLDLQRVVQESGPLAPARVIHVLAQIAGALNEAHRAGLVHRDLKPANVFLCDRGGQRDTVKVLDFGLVKDKSNDGDPARTELNALIGTPMYLSPESIHSPAEVETRRPSRALHVSAGKIALGRTMAAGAAQPKQRGACCGCRAFYCFQPTR